MDHRLSKVVDDACGDGLFGAGAISANSMSGAVAVGKDGGGIGAGVDMSGVKLLGMNVAGLPRRRAIRNAVKAARETREMRTGRITFGTKDVD